jgi:hypothetical protein
MKSLVPDDLRALLPPLREADDPEPVVYAHYLVPDRAWHYYVTNGNPRRDYELFGLLLPSEDEEEWRWTSLRESALEKIVGVRRDEAFVPGPFPDSVPYPYSD